MVGHLCARQRGYNDEQDTALASRMLGRQASKQIIAKVYVKWWGQVNTESALRAPQRVA